MLPPPALSSLFKALFPAQLQTPCQHVFLCISAGRVCVLITAPFLFLAAGCESQTGFTEETLSGSQK